LSVPDRGPLVSPHPSRPGRRARRSATTAPRAAIAPLAALLLAALGVLAAAGSLGPGAIAAEPTPTTPPDPSPPPSIVFYGRGYGHGVGMSQYGARGRALAGQDAPTILAHYYQGATLNTTDPRRPVRVLLLRSYRPTAARPLRLYGRGGSWTIDGVAATFPTDAQLRVTRAATGLRVVVRDAAGVLLLDRVVGWSLRVRAGPAAAARIQVWSKPSVYDRYRGVIRLRATSAGIDVVNEIQLDLYLRGVVPAEMPAGWPVEALRAQAIAARSYAAHRLHPRTGFFDLYDDGRTQVYRGSLGERASTNRAVTATAGQVLRSGATIANTLYHSTAGGATEDNENVYTSATGRIVAGPVPYLRGSPDRAPDGTPYDAAAPHETWQTAAYTLAQLSVVFGADERTNVGDLSALDLSDVGVSGRLISVTLTGSLGTKTVSGNVFRSVFNLNTPASDPYMWSTLVSTAPIP